ncbi:MAG TPA: GNAT family N-acetyltransferase [Thermoanaerobaculia bacterium]
MSDARRLLAEALTPRSMTNYFRQPLAEESIVIRGTDSLVVLAPERTFHRLYFVTRNIDELGALLREITPGREVVIEQVHHEDDPLAHTFTSAGYEQIARYQRMWNRDMRTAPADGRFTLATAKDLAEIDALLVTVFDPRTDHLPDIHGLAEREIIIRRIDGRLCGFIAFVVEGAVANFNYIYSDCGDPSITSAMIDTFYALARERGARRTFLWVDDRKPGVIRLYEGFGWRADGLRASYYRKAA